MWDFRASSSMPTQSDTRNASQIGADIGRGFGAAANFVVGARGESKANDLIAAYNNASDTTIFGGLKGSARTSKLASLLQPYDAEAAAKYSAQAENEKKAEGIQTENEAVKTAYTSVPTMEDDTSSPENTSVDAEIELITRELKRRGTEGIDAPPGISSTGLPYAPPPPKPVDLLGRYKLMGAPNA